MEANKSYINPFVLINFDKSILLTSEAVRKAKRRLLIEFDLTDDNTVDYNGRTMSKDDAIRAIEEINDFKKGYLHHCIFMEDHLSEFLSTGDLTYFKNPKIQSFHSDPEYLEFISLLFISKYNKILSESYTENRFSQLRLLDVKHPLSDSKYKENCYADTKEILSVSIKRIKNLQTDIEQNIETYKNSVSIGRIEQTIQYLVNAKSINLLPDYFQEFREKTIIVLAKLSLSVAKLLSAYDLAVIIFDKAQKINVINEDVKVMLIRVKDELVSLKLAEKENKKKNIKEKAKKEYKDWREYKNNKTYEKDKGRQKSTLEEELEEPIEKITDFFKDVYNKYLKDYL